MGIIIPLYALIAPFILWPIEYYLPYPFIIEEIAKGILVYIVVTDKTIKNKVSSVVIAALLFSISESFFYLINIYQVGNISTLFMRFVLTTPMHIITALVILFFGMKDKRLIPLGVVIAGVIHLFFNATILTLKL
jgi:predicted RNase H-related nuclease YkuK (DUF458 family)